MEPEKDQEFLDYFNQPIALNSKVLAAINHRIRVCSVVKLNRRSIILTEVNFRNGKEIRAKPEDTILLAGEDLTLLSLRKGWQL